MKPFDVAFTSCCALVKADIPEVEAIKRLIGPLVLARLELIGTRLLDELIARLDRIPVAQTEDMRRTIVDALLTAALADAERVYSIPFDRDTRDAIRDAVDALLAAGGLASGRSDPRSSRLPIAAAAAELELTLMVRAAVTGQFGELRGLLGRFLTDPATRAGQGLGVSILDQQVMRLLEPTRAVGAAIDTWAYGTFNQGNVAGADLTGVRGYRLRATLDGHETAFCRWVNGRVVPIARVLRQEARLQAAAFSGDPAAVIAARPFLSPSIAMRGNELQFELFFRRVGLPPYHFGCRTQPIPVS